MRTINEIIIHCSDTREGQDFTVKDITSWHKDRGFKTIGYHYVIYRDGSIHAGRPEEEQGAHCKEGGHNRHSIGICYIGGRSADGKTYVDTRTPEQKEAMLSLLRRLKARYPNARVYGHRDFAARACPCFDAAKEYIQLVIALLLVFSCSIFSACRTTRRTASEQADSEVQQAVSQTATSQATDKFLQDLVLHIDSIVVTTLPMPPVPEDSASTRGATSSGTRNKSPRKGGSKVVVSGISLQSHTADSSVLFTAYATDSTFDERKHRLVKGREVKKPAASWSLWLPFILFFIAVAVGVAIAIAMKKTPFLAAFRSLLRKAVA